jgi:hypothetical protein
VNKRNNSSADEHNAEQSTMLISTLLLIAGLLLTSILLLDTGLAHKNFPNQKNIKLSQTLEKATGMLTYAKTKLATPPPLPSSQANTSGTKGDGILGFTFKEKNKDKNGVRWPRLKLSGFGKAAEGETGFAIINKNRINVGDTTSGATLVKILDQGVELEYKGATRILTMEMAYQ